MLAVQLGSDNGFRQTVLFLKTHTVVLMVAHNTQLYRLLLTVISMNLVLYASHLHMLSPSLKTCVECIVLLSEISSGMLAEQEIHSLSEVDKL